MKQFFNTLVHYFLWSLTTVMFWRVREVPVNGKPYLRRFYIFKRSGRLFNFPFAVYLHYFYNGDEDRELHNHPWDKSRSLILAGGYTEFRKKFAVDEMTGETKSYVMPLVYKPGKINTIERDDFHRITLDKKYYGKYTWTLFFSGDRTSDYDDRYGDWEFWDSLTDTKIPHGAFEELKKEREKLISAD